LNASRETTAAPAAHAGELGAAEFDALLDAAVDAIIVIDHSGRIVRFNKAAESMFGYRSAEILGQPISMLMGSIEGKSHQQFVSRYLRSGMKHIIGIGREVVARRADGSLFPASLSVGEAQSAGALRFVGLMRDLTEQKRIEEETLRHRDQMVHASRLTTMGEMAAAMAHELNQPLSAIATYTAACKRFLDKGEEARADVVAVLQEIGAQAHRAGEIIQRMRDFTRTRQSQRRPTDVAAMIEEIRPLAELDARANHVPLTMTIDPDLPPVAVDGIQIQQVILNLLRNGVDAMANVSEAERRLDLRAWPQPDQTVRIDITDHGHGVSEAARQHLFTPFFTTKAAGMGMGLAISRSIITAHGGKLDCVNNPDGGATFYFTLPTTLTN
jgi:two-component system sensor kinase FixL